MPDRTNSWLFKRELPALTIVVQAHYIKPLHSWGMTCKVNGHLVDHRQSDNPTQCALEMVEEATLNSDHIPSGSGAEHVAAAAV